MTNSMISLDRRLDGRVAVGGPKPLPAAAVPTITRRRLTALLGASAGAALPACGLQTGPTADPGQSTDRSPVTIEYYTTLNARQNDNHKALLLEPFTRANPHITVNVIPSEGDFQTKLRALAAGGTPPDVTWTAYPEYFLGGLIQDIAQLVKRDKYNLGVWPKGLFEGMCTWRGGKIIGLPNQSGGNWPVMPYNKDLFKQAGAPEPPATWGDTRWNTAAYLDTLQKTTRTGADGKVASYGTNQAGPGLYTANWPGMWSASWLSDDFKTITCDSAQMVEAMQYLVDLIVRHRVMASGPMLSEAFGNTNATTAFLNGRLATLIVAGGGLFALTQAVAEGNLPIAYAPTPLFKATNAANNVDDNGIVSGAKHPDEAWAYVKWQADTPNWAISRGTFPARPDHVDAWAKELFPGTLAKDMHLDVQRDSLKNANRIDPIFHLPTYRKMSAELIQPAFAKMTAGQANASTALKEIKAPLQSLVPVNLP